MAAPYSPQAKEEIERRRHQRLLASVSHPVASEDEIQRLYYVRDGERHQFADWNGPVSSGIWHELNVSANDDLFEISWDGKKVIEARDKTFSETGKIGLWTKADSVTYFDDLKVEAR